MPNTMANGALGDKPDGGDINKSAFAPQPTGKFTHAWDRAPVASKAPRLQGKKVWKKLMRALGAPTGDDEKLQQAQAELETAGAGTRKKMRMASAKTNIRDAEWDGTEWHGFADDVMAGVQGAVNENDSTPTSRKRRNNDKIVTPRKALRQASLNQQATTPSEDVLDDEVTIAKRARKAMRKSGGSRMSLPASEHNITTTPESKASDATPVKADATHETTAAQHASSTISLSPSKLSPNRKARMRSKSTLQRRTSVGEPRRLSGALFADASPTTTSTTIDFNASTAEGMRFGAKPAFGTPVRTPVGTPVRAGVSAFSVLNAGAPRTAPAKIQPTRSEIEQEMASFFTPIPRLKKIKRRSSPIKSYLQQLLENREEVVSANQEAQDAQTPEKEVHSALAFARDAPCISPASPQTPVAASSPLVQGSSPCVTEYVAEDKVEVHSSVDAVVSAVVPAVRLDFNLVPDLSIEGIGSFADGDSELVDEETDAEDEVNASSGEEEDDEEDDIDDIDPEEQLRAELAASQEELAPESETESETRADGEIEVAEDEPMLDAPTSIAASSDISEVANASKPAFESSLTVVSDDEIAIDAAGLDGYNSGTSTDENSTDESAADNTTNVSTSFDEEETAMLLAFVTKNQAKKLARTSPKSKTAHAPHSPLRLPLGEVTGNTSPPIAKKTAKGAKVEKPASATKKSRRLNPSTAIDIPSDTLPENAVPESSSTVRRSGRTAVKESKIPAPPSFIPVRGLSGVAPDGVEIKAPKKEKTVEQITKLNTGKNKAGCLHPMVVLKRIKMEEKAASKSSSKESLVLAEEKKAGKDGKEKKKLVWAKELTAVREFEERSIVRPAVAPSPSKADKRKEKVAGAKLEETKKTRVRVGTASERASKLALGMVANGTPAKRTVREVAGEKEEKKKEEKVVKRVRQPKLRSPKVGVAGKKAERVAKAEKVEKVETEDVVMG